MIVQSLYNRPLNDLCYVGVANNVSNLLKNSSKMNNSTEMLNIWRVELKCV